jgi:hypothetical protein
MVLNSITSPQQAHLRSLWQRPRLYVAMFGTFETQISTVMKDANKERSYQIGEWKPIINIGPHRIGFVGEPINFDASDSYKMNFIGGKHRRRSQAQGYGKGASLGQLNWTIGAWQRLGRQWQQTQTWTPTAAGLYTLNVTSSDGGKANRWIRVYENRDAADISVSSIQGLQGAWGEGWSCELTFQDETLELENLNVADGQCFGIYCEDMWWDGTNWVTDVVGNNRHDARVVMIGYAKEGTIQKNSQMKQVTLTLETIHGQMDRSQGHKVAIWNEKGPETEDGDPDDNTKGTGSRSQRSRRKQRRRRRRRKARGQSHKRAEKHKNKKKGDGRKTDSWGSILKGFKEVCISDFAAWLLQFKSNLLDWHDFYCLWHEDAADLESIAGEETSVLSNLATVAANDWFVSGAMADSSIYFLPDRQVTQDGGLDAQWPTRLTLGDDDILDINIMKKTEKPIKYVKLIATKTADFQSDAKRRKKARKQEKKNQIEKSFPGKDPPVDVAGGWFVRSDLLHDNERVIKKRCEQVYNYMNQRWSGQLSMALNRSLTPGQTFVLAPSNLSALMGSASVGCLVRSVSYEIDMPTQTWKTTVDFENVAAQTAWSPTLLGTNLLGWYEGTTGITLDGSSRVSQWNDISGNARHLTQATTTSRPYPLSNGVFFSVSPQGLSNAALPNWSATEGRLVLAVVTLTRGTSYALYSGASNNAISFHVPSTGGVNMGIRKKGVGDTLTGPATPNGYMSVLAWDAKNTGGQTGTPYWNLAAANGVFTQGYHNTTYTTSSLTIGYDGTTPFVGTIHELIICKSMTWWERTLLEGYLAWKWGVIGQFPYTHSFKTYAPMEISSVGGA